MQEDLDFLFAGPMAKPKAQPVNGYADDIDFLFGNRSKASPQPTPPQQPVAQQQDNSGSYAGGLARSALGQGLALGFGDEIEAYIRSTVGDEDYDTALATVRAGLQQFQQENPKTALTAEIAGALVPALLSGGTAAPASIGSAMVRGAVAGGATGAALGFGKGEDGLENRLDSAETGLKFGAGFGAAGPALLRGVGGAVNAGRDLTRSITTPIRSAVSADKEAARRVAGALHRDRLSGAGGLTDDQFAAAQNAGQPVTNLDRGGETTRALMRSAANTSPEARASFTRAIDDRFEGQAGRVVDFVNRLTSGRIANVAGAGRVKLQGPDMVDNLREMARRQNAPRYRRAMAEGNRPINSPELERLMSSPLLVDAMRSAVKKGKDRAVRDGYGGFNAGVQVSDDGIINFTRTGADGVPQYPNLQFWDAVKRQLDQKASVAFRKGANEDGGLASGLARQLRDELDSAVPSYARAREGAHSLFGAEDAMTAGQAFVRGAQNPREAHKALSKMTSGERALFAHGFAQELTNTALKARDRVNVVNRIYGSPQAREKIKVALGPKAAMEMESFMRVESLMDLARGAMGNSTTARQLAEMGLAGGGATVVTGDFSPQTFLGAALAFGAARRGAAHVDTKVQQRVARMLMSNDPKQFQAAVLKISRSSEMMAALKRATEHAAQLTGVGGSVAATQD